MLRRETNFNLGRSSKRAVASSIPIVALLLLGGMVVGMLSPVASTALPFGLGSMGAEEAYAEGANIVVTFSAYEPASVTLTMADKVSGEIVPEREGSFTNLATVARVDVTNSDYYDLSIYGTSMQNETRDATIGAVAAGSKPSGFGDNTWGYSLVQNTVGQNDAVVANSNTTYQPVPTTSTNILRQNTNTETKVANDTYTLNFGAKIDTSLPAGTYSSTVTLSVVANPAFIATGFDRVSTMQELTPEICKEIGTEADNYGKGYAYTDPLGNTYWTKQLRDERDDKLYWVAKLADGNCWMTQNLALDIPSEGLTSELTALNPANINPETGIATWKPIEATRTPETPNRFTISECANLTEDEETACLNKNADYSWDEGVYVLVYPGMGSDMLWVGRTAEQGGLSGFADREWLASLGVDSKMLVDGQLVFDVSGSEWTVSTDPDFTANHSGYAVDVVSKTYDAHYLIGNYYQWLAATAQTVAEGQQVTEAGTKVEGSICAKGWELPTSGSYGTDTSANGLTYNAASGSFFNLINSTSSNALITGGSDGSNANVNNGYSALSQSIGTNVTTESILTGSPMHFLRAGNVFPWASGQQVQHVGVAGVYWSSVATSATDARHLYFTPGYVNPSYGSPRAYGIFVRCFINTAE